MSKAIDWIPVLLPKEVVKQLLKEYIVLEKGQSSYMEILKNLQNKVRKMKLFSGMNEQQIIRKLHQTKKKLLKENPDVYIDYSS